MASFNLAALNLIMLRRRSRECLPDVEVEAGEGVRGKLGRERRQDSRREREARMARMEGLKRRITMTREET